MDLEFKKVQSLINYFAIEINHFEHDFALTHLINYFADNNLITSQIRDNNQHQQVLRDGNKIAANYGAQIQ